jgi:epsilon-lactone hydrolase
VSLASRAVKGFLRIAVRSRLNPAATPEVQRRAFALAMLSLPCPRGTEASALDDPRIRGEWVQVSAPRKDAALLYLHGGGFVIGSTGTHRSLVARLAAASGTRALSLDYRLAPEAPFPAALDDALAAYALLRRTGLAAERIAVAGDSAGGGLAVSLLVALRARGEALPAAALLLSPWVDLTLSGESMRTRAATDCVLTPEWLRRMAERYAAGVAADDARLSPLGADLTGLPPILIQVGSDEILADDSIRLAAALRAAGVAARLDIAAGLFHAYPMGAPFVPEARVAIAEAGEFLRRRLSHES